MMMHPGLLAQLGDDPESSAGPIAGLVIAAIGFMVLGYASVGSAGLVFRGIALFAVGEMIASPRIQEYVTWLAPKEKAGLYMGANFLGTMIGGLLMYTV